MQNIIFISNRKHQIDDLNVVSEEVGIPMLIDYLDSVDIVAYDKETTSVDPFEAIQLLDSIGDDNIQFVIDMTSVSIKSIKHKLLDKLVIGHNIAYDYRVNEARKRYYNEDTFDIKNVYDTMIVEQRLGLGSGRKNSLDAVYQRRLKKMMPTSKDTRSQFVGRSRSIIFTQEQVEYSAGDVECLPLIKNVQKKFIDSLDMQLLIDIEHNCLLPLALTSIIGIKLDQDMWKELIESNIKSKKNLEIQMDKELEFIGYKQKDRKVVAIEQLGLFGDTVISKNKSVNNINYNSTQQVCELISKLGYPVPTVEEFSNGQVIQKNSISEGSVEMYKYSYPNSPLLDFFNLLLDYKEASKALNSFGRRFLVETYIEKGKKTKKGYYREVTGNVHTLYRQCVTENGRLASGNEKEGYFNSQQIPKQKKYRLCFKAPTEGYYVTTADLSGAEMVILGALSEDTRLLELVQKGDIHSTIASAAYTNICRKIVNLYQFDNSKLIKELTDILKPNKIYKSLGELDDAEKNEILKARINHAINNNGEVIVNKEDSKDIRDPFKNVIYGTSWTF